MDETASRFWSEIMSRPAGPLGFRFLLQPAMAMLYAIRDGRRDARQQRPAYFWAIFTEPGSAWPLLREGRKAVGRVIVLGIVMDVIYQFIVFKWVYPLQLIVVVFVLLTASVMLLAGLQQF